MRVLFVMTLLVALAPPVGQASGSPRIDIPAEELQTLRTQANQGVAEAQTNLGLLYYDGRSVPKDYAQAREWFEKAAAQGDANAQYNLGVMYDFEKGVPQDFEKARQWYEKAAAQGHVGAQTNLGGLYEFGHGVSQDAVRAYMWYHIAATLSTNDPEKDIAAENRDEIGDHMTSAQKKEAKRLASRCQAQRFKSC
jgi:TPR repeat protein